jgi:aminoglycoside phosphotransferase (APT) family kinase protein
MQSPGSGRVVDTPAGEEEAIHRHLVQHAPLYWPVDDRGAGPAEEPRSVLLVRADRRLTGRLYWYRIETGAAARTVIVKITDPSGLPASRLRLAGLADTSAAFVDEYEALRRIEDRFVSLADARIGHSRILDRIHPFGAIVMERVPGEPMIRLFLHSHRLRPAASRERLLVTARRTGLWLRQFHAVGVAPRVIHRQDRAEFMADVERYAQHIAALIPADADRLHALTAAIREAAAQDLPEQLPMATAHSDFAMRNVIVEPGGRVVVLDTLARRQAPIYEDLATFDVDLRFGSLPPVGAAIAFPSGLTDAVHAAVLEGYFGDDALPVRGLQVYRTLVLLDRWAALLSRPSRPLWRRPARRLASLAIRREVLRAAAGLR